MRSGVSLRVVKDNRFYYVLSIGNFHNTTQKFSLQDSPLYEGVSSKDSNFLNVFWKETSEEHVNSVGHQHPGADGGVHEVSPLLIDKVGYLVLSGRLVGVLLVGVVLLHHPNPLAEVPHPFPESLPSLLQSAFSVT